MMIGRMVSASLLAGVMAVGLLGCTGSSKPEAPTSGTAAAGAASTLSKAAETVTQHYLSETTATALASAQGTVKGGDGDVPGTVDVLAVRASTASTVVRWRLSANEPVTTLSLDAYRNLDWKVDDVSGVTLVAKQADLQLKAGHWANSQVVSGNCICAWQPNNVDSAGIELSMLYPALPASVTEVQLKVPGFPAISVPVTRE